MNSKFYENIVLKHDKFAEETMIALGLVKKYIIKNKLIIVGGMAIDLSLKLRGSKLYDDDILPDYDFYSPNYSKDAYHISEMLVKAGLNNISVINANHISTMRVRVNYTVVADVTYIPKNIFDKLPYLQYKDIKIIHPHYQIIDQHRALSYPYENAPHEVIAHRWKKDAERYDLLYTQYPLTDDIIDIQDITLTDPINISSILFKDQCISGFAGLLYWQAKAISMKYKNKFKNLGLCETDVSGMVFKIPVDSHGISVYSNNIIELEENIKKKHPIEQVRMYNRFLDKLPFKILLDNKFELFDNAGCLLSAYKTDIDIYVANLQNIMLYMLTNLILFKNLKEIDRGYSFYLGYLAAKDIVEWASNEYSKSKKGMKSNKYNIFLPSPDVFGTDEISDSYINSKRLFLEKTEEILPEQLQPMLVFPETFKKDKVPEKYYRFNPRDSHILQFDGEITNIFSKRIYL
jgi:hypothetical protein